VSSYSTRGGTSAYTDRLTSPSRSRSRSVSVRTFPLTQGLGPLRPRRSSGRREQRPTAVPPRCRLLFGPDRPSIRPTASSRFSPSGARRAVSLSTPPQRRAREQLARHQQLGQSPGSGFRKRRQQERPDHPRARDPRRDSRSRSEHDAGPGDSQYRRENDSDAFLFPVRDLSRTGSASLRSRRSGALTRWDAASAPRAGATTATYQP
jgi:hypothetical protein